MDVVLLLVRLFLAAVLLVAGLAKLADVAGSRRSLMAFGLPQGLAAPLGVALPVVELIAAVALIPSSTARFGALLSLALFALFILGIAYVVLIKRRSPACNCFGALYSGQAGGPAVVRNAILAGLAALVVARGNGNSATAWLGNIGTAGAIALGVGALTIALFAIAIWLFLDLLGQNGRLLMRLETVESDLAAARSASPAASRITAPAQPARSVPNKPVAPLAVQAAAPPSAEPVEPTIAAPTQAPAAPTPPAQPTATPANGGSPAPSRPSGRRPTAPKPAELPLRAPAPQFTASNLDGELVTLGSLRTARKPILLVFADLQDGASNALLPDIGRWQRDHSDRLNTVLVVRGPSEVNRPQTTEHGLTTVLVQKDTEISDMYRVHRWPTALLVRPDGRIGSNLATGADLIRSLAQRAIDTLAKSPPPSPLAAAAAAERQAEPAAAPAAEWQAEPAEVAPHADLAVGDAAPPVRLPNLVGQTVDLAAFRGNDVAVLFWSPTCNFSRRLLPELRTWEENPPAGAPRLFIIAGGSADAVRAAGFRSPVVLDEGFTVGRAFGAHGTPSAVIVDDAGRIASEVATGAASVMALLKRGQTDLPLANGAARTPVAPIGTDAPSLRLPDLDGNEVELGSFRGRRVLLLFWNPDCTYCEALMPDLRSWDAAAMAGDTALLIVSAGSTDANRALGLRSTILLDDAFRTARDFRASGTPSAILIDEDGRLASEVAVGATGVRALARSAGFASAPVPA